MQGSTVVHQDDIARFQRQVHGTVCARILEGIHCLLGGAFPEVRDLCGAMAEPDPPFSVYGIE